MTISRKLVLTLLVVALTPLLVALLTVNKLVVQQTEQLVGARLQDNVEQTARAIDQFMLDSMRNLKAFSDASSERVRDTTGLSQHLRGLTYSYPSFRDLRFVDTKGRILAASDLESIGKNILDTQSHLLDEFEKAKKDKHGQVYVSDTSDVAQNERKSGIGQVASEPPLYMFAAMHDAQGNLLGVLAGKVVIGGIRDLVVELSHRTPGHSGATLLDTDGHVFVSSDARFELLQSLPNYSEPSFQARLAAGKSGWYRHNDSTNTLVMTGYTPLWNYGANRAGGWKLVTDAPYSAIMNPVKETVSQLLAAFGLLLVGAAALGLFIARDLSQPLLKLADAARSLSNGDYSVRVKIKTHDETGLLGETFNLMAGQVEQDRAVARTEMANRLSDALDLQKAKEDAERANMAKNEFLSHMSHELRTPLNAVLGFAQLLQMQSDDPNTLESAQSILKGGRHLLSLVNEVLDLARIEAGRMTLSVEAVQVLDAIDQAVEMVRPLAEERGVSISITTKNCGDLHVEADRQRLIQVLLNLLSNAAKYNKPNGRIEVRCFTGTTGMPRIEILDSGRGIRESELSRLFQPFERLGENNTDGTGLGLALSRKLMRLMGGELSLVTTGEDGSKFALEFNPAEAPALVLEQQVSPVETSSKEPNDFLRIVYIEDNLSNLELLERFFEQSGGIQLLPAMQARLGIQLVEDHLPDLVLLDLHLPDLPGLEVLQRLQANPLTSHIPVVVLSADATEKQIKTLLEAGARSYLTKPIDLEALCSELKGIKFDRRSA